MAYFQGPLQIRNGGPKSPGGVKASTFSHVGRQQTLRDPVFQVTLREMCKHALLLGGSAAKACVIWQQVHPIPPHHHHHQQQQPNTDHLITAATNSRPGLKPLNHNIMDPTTDLLSQKASVTTNTGTLATDCPATRLQRLQILGTTDPLLNILTTPIHWR